MAMRHLPLNALRSFEAAARLLSFNDAAAELGVTPSAVSLQIRRLEDLTGRLLFIRNHRSVTLSQTGARLASRLSKLFTDFERLLSEVFEPAVSLINITSMPSFATKWLAPRLANFSVRHPEFQTRVAGGDALVNFDRMDVDIGLRYGSGAYAGVHCEKIADAVAFPVCSPAFLAQHASSLTSPITLRDFPLLHDEISAQAPGLPTWASWFEKAGVERITQHRGPLFESLHMALAAAQAGQGIALGLTPLVNDDLNNGRLVRLFDIGISSAYAFWLVCSQDRLNDRKIAAFRAWLKIEMEAMQN